MSIEAMKQMLDALQYIYSDLTPHEDQVVDEAIQAGRAAIEQAERNEFNPDWNRVQALQESLREYMAEIQRLRGLLEQAEKKRCPLCDYQHGHQIGCKNNPVDIALAKQAEKQEPVAWMHPEWNTYTRAPAMSITPKEDWIPLYTAPPRQEKQEPVAWADKYDIEREGHDFYVNRQQPSKDGVPLYTAPPHFLDPAKVARLLDEAFEHGKKEAVSEQAMDIAQKLVDSALLNSTPPQRDDTPAKAVKWQGLTDEEIGELWGEPVDFMYSGHYDSIRAIEQAIKEKNHARH